MLTCNRASRLTLTALVGAASLLSVGSAQAVVLSPSGDTWVNERFTGSGESAKVSLATVRESSVAGAEESWFAFVAFDISGQDLGSITDATLELHVTDGGYASGDLLLYAAKDGSLIDVDAPGHVVPRNYRDVAATTEYNINTYNPVYGDIVDDIDGLPDPAVFDALPNLWTFGVDAALVADDAVSVSGTELLTFLQNDTNGRVVFLIQSSDAEDKAMHSSEATDPALRPTLTLVPEPASLALLGLGGLALLGRSRRS